MFAYKDIFTWVILSVFMILIWKKADKNTVVFLVIYVVFDCNTISPPEDNMLLSPDQWWFLPMRSEEIIFWKLK